jgi:hypothetical protein
MIGFGRLANSRSIAVTLLALVAMVLSNLLVGCGTTSVLGPRAEPIQNRIAPTTLVMIIRHGEKPDGSASGVDANGNADDSSLTRTGWNRAQRLVDLFDPAQGSPRTGVARPTAIFAAGANGNGEGKRTRETVTPLADELGIPIDTTFGKGEEGALVKRVISWPGPTLISWQHGEIPTIAQAFPSVTPAPPTVWPDDRFDVIWTFTKTADGWHFAQQPELALPQDRPTVIGN